MKSKRHGTKIIRFLLKFIPNYSLLIKLIPKPSKQITREKIAVSNIEFSFVGSSAQRHKSLGPLCFPIPPFPGNEEN